MLVLIDCAGEGGPPNVNMANTILEQMRELHEDVSSLVEIA